MATTYCKIISYGLRANLNYLNSLLTIFFFFDSLWRDLYFRRYPTFFTDADFKQRVGDGWRKRLSIMMPHSRLFNTMPLPPHICNYIEEILTSPSDLPQNQFFISPDIGFFSRLAELLADTPLFNVFKYNSRYQTGYLSVYRSIVNEFASTLATAKAAGKKTLLLVPSVDSTSPVGLNPIIKQEKLAEQLVDIIKNYKRDNIIVWVYSSAIEHLTPLLVETFTEHCTLVEINKPDKNERKSILAKRQKNYQPLLHSIKRINFCWDLDEVTQATEGLTRDAMDLFIRHVSMAAMANQIAQYQSMDVVVGEESFRREMNALKFELTAWENNHKILREIIAKYPNARYLLL
jgi:hypothetical protein